MKRFFSLLCLSVLAAGSAMAQSFSNTAGGAIPDAPAPAACFPVTVSGLPTQIDTTFGLAKVTLNITHSYDSDLRIRLRAPNGTTILLVDRRGGSDDNFVATDLRMNAHTPIATGVAPFTGAYIPDSSLNRVNVGLNPNGTWSLCIQDMIGQDVGNLNSVTLTFAANPPRDPAAPPAPCSLTNPAGCHCADSAVAICDLLPDMTASGQIMAQNHTETPGQLRLSNATPNIGWGPMEIHGSGQCYCDTVAVNCGTTTLCPDGTEPKERVLQRIYHKNNNQMTSYDRPAGYMSFHPAHGHVHVDKWSQFTLRTRGAGTDPRNWPVVAAGQKISFCLINLGDCSANPGYCRDTANNILTLADIPNAGFGSVTGCGRDQGIFTGSLDIYDQGLPGQYIDLPGVCNGTYFLVSVTDPDNNFLEADESNNWAYTQITLTQQLPRTPPTFTYSRVGNLYAFSGAGLPAGARFRWNFHDGSPLDSVNNPTIHGFASPGVHTVTLTSIAPCGADSVTRTFTVLGTGQDAPQPTFSLRAAPNPTTGQTAFSYHLPTSGSVTLDAYNVLGQRVRHSAPTGVQPAGDHTAALDFGTDLPAGVYLVWLRTESGTQAVRVVKE